MIFGWFFPWALPKATLCMAVGQIVGERWRVRVLTFGGPFFNKSVVGHCRGKRGNDPG